MYSVWKKQLRLTGSKSSSASQSLGEREIQNGKDLPWVSSAFKLLAMDFPLL